MSENFLSGLLNNGLLLVALGWLLKALVSDKLKTISTDIHELKTGRAEDSKKVQSIEVTIAEIKERHRQEDTWGGLDRRLSGEARL